ncbi:hypothetical protein SAY87_025779 [Trapa incisa]|uniref:SOUL heme-binding family protein n=1 Tax=Trapa incisa TaxID=236973 RepID=A0AAN7H1T7_9MYRT|nr:hypothetical protein SAY87_025779 [Trapa incisa]
MNLIGPSVASSRTAVRNFEFRSTYAFITNGKHQPTVLWHQDIGDKGSRWSEHLESPSFPNLPSTPGPGFCRPCVARAIKRRHQGNNLSNLGPVRLKLKWIQRASPEDQAESSLKPTINMDRLVEFLYDDLPHLFDDQGIDRTAYDDCVKFRDPITKHDTLSGYLFNIAFLKTAFQPMFYLHSVKQTGPYDITTRWTMVMKFMPLPWKPELIFTGTSVMGINPATGKFCSHVDYWDSIQNNEYFSLEGLLDVFKQLRIYKTPYLETPKYQILKRTSNYEVRRYEPFIVVETDGDKLSGSKGFNDVAGYIFGKNSTQEKIPMTTPVFTQALDNKLSKVAIQIVLPLEKDMNNLPDPSQERISLRKVQGGMAAVLKFSGNPSEDVVLEKEMKLRKSLESDGLRPKIGCLLARYNDPGRTWSFMLRNEVLIWLEEFELC